MQWSIIPIEAVILPSLYRKCISEIYRKFPTILTNTYSQLGTSYCLATAGALGTALSLNSLVKRAPPLIGRFVPFFAGNTQHDKHLYCT